MIFNIFPPNDTVNTQMIWISSANRQVVEIAQNVFIGSTCSLWPALTLLLENRTIPKLTETAPGG
jgi:hypothetical protein